MGRGRQVLSSGADQSVHITELEGNAAVELSIKRGSSSTHEVFLHHVRRLKMVKEIFNKQFVLLAPVSMCHWGTDKQVKLLEQII